ncbi:hypothetical protein IKI14_00855 [bacterium]|nr:hypothetical protein [bacterium]
MSKDFVDSQHFSLDFILEFSGKKLKYFLNSSLFSGEISQSHQSIMYRVSRAYFSISSFALCHMPAKYQDFSEILRLETMGNHSVAEESENRELSH